MDLLPQLKVARKLKGTDSLNYIKDVIKCLKNEQNVENEGDLKNLSWRVANFYFDYGDFQEKVCELLIEEDLCKIINNIFIYLIKVNNIQSGSMENILNILINFSAVNISFSSLILSSDLFKSFVDFCVDHTEDLILSDTGFNKCLCSIVNIIHNVVLDRDNTLEYKDNLFKHSLVKYIKYNNSDKLGRFSMLTLSYIIEDEENEVNLLNDASNVIGFLIERMKNINPVDNRSGGFKMDGLLNGLRCISVNDNMKEKIVQENGITLLLNILEGDFEIKEKELTLEILHNLCFLPVVKESLKNEYKIEDVIKTFINNENLQIKQHCDGIMWLLKETPNFQKQCLLNKNSKYKFDVFLSYSRKHREIIDQVKKWIVDSNLKVWIDDEQMFGSIPAAMAKGIENSKIIVIGVSKAYKESPNCRLEAEYAVRLHKPIVSLMLQYKYKPRSWLGIIVGNQMPYDFSEIRDTNETMSSVLKYIQTLLNDNDSSERSDDENVTRDIDKFKSKVVDYKSTERIRNMTKENVGQWLLDSDLGNYRKYFLDMDGSLLDILISFKYKSLKYFNFTLKKEFRMKFVDVLKFHKAVNFLLIEN